MRSVVAAGLAASAMAALPEFTPQLRDQLWEAANQQAKNAGGEQQHTCGYGAWGDSGQLNQWDQGFSPCWPSTMNIGATWDVELMARWSVEMAREFGEPNRGQLGPGINIARYAWNGRLGEYMSGEDPFLGAKMIESQVRAYRQIDRPAVQTVKHWIPNTIETDRNGMTEVVDERTLFEVYYPPFQAAIDAGVSAVMCSYNLINCTSGMCNSGRAYACANDDIINKHLKQTMGFKGILMSDWDATKCQAEAAGSGGCKSGSYIDKEFAADAGLDLEMPACMSFGGGVTKRTREKEARMRWTFLVQGRDINGQPLSNEDLGRALDGRRLQGAPVVNASGALQGRRLLDCSWLPADNCQDTTESACACRAANPQGPCTPCNPTSKCQGSCCGGTCPGVAAAIAQSAAPVETSAPSSPVFSEECSWLPSDNCQDNNKVACACRAANPQGPCTSCKPTSTCRGSCCGSTCPGVAAAIVQNAPPAEPSAPSAPVPPEDQGEGDGWCCWWPQSGDNICGACTNSELTATRHKCLTQKGGSWCLNGATAPAAPAAPAAQEWHPPLPAPAPATAAPAPATGAPAPATAAPTQKPDNWQSGIYKSNPFGESQYSSSASHAGSVKVRLFGKQLETCPHVGSDNYKSPCKLDLAARIIAESTVLLKNSGGVLPLAKDASVALVGTQACSTDPLAQAGGSGWNGFACNQVPKVNLKDGIAGLKDGPQLECSTHGAGAEVVVAMVSPEKASEGGDRSTIQLHAEDIAMIKQFSAAGKKVVVVINAPGPMITSTWDEGVAAILISWLPGQQNGRGIAMALYGEEHEASGRLPFTFPKCRTQDCTIADERASVQLGDGIENKQNRIYSEKGLVGYRWYHAKQIEVSYPFGFGLFAYGSTEVNYSDAQAVRGTGQAMVKVSFAMANEGPRAGHEVPQMYLSFPSDIPGDANSKPEWILKGFAKTLLEPSVPAEMSFLLTQRDLSYWDDAPGKSLWVCASGEFRVCVGSNSRDAILPNKGACTTFTSPCAVSIEVVKKKLLKRNDNSVPSQAAPVQVSPAVLLACAVACGALAAAALGVVRRGQSQGWGGGGRLQLVPSGELDTVD